MCFNNNFKMNSVFLKQILQIKIFLLSLSFKKKKQ